MGKSNGKDSSINNPTTKKTDSPHVNIQKTDSLVDNSNVIDKSNDMEIELINDIAIKQEKISTDDIDKLAAATFIQTSNSKNTTSKSIHQNINRNDSSKDSDVVIKQEKSSPDDIEKKASVTSIQTTNTQNATSKSISQNINQNDSFKEIVKAQKTESMKDDLGITPLSMFEIDNNSDGVEVNLRSPKKGKDDLSELSFGINEKEAPPLVNEQNKNVVITGQRRVGVKELRLQMRDSDNSTISNPDESDSESEENIQIQIKEFQFRFLRVPITEKVTCCVYSSIHDHPWRKKHMEHFQFDDDGNVKENSKQTVKDLVLFSKKIWLTKMVLNKCYEGMYGFIADKYFALVKKTTTIQEKKNPLIWQYLKTTRAGEYSREKSLKYLKGKSQTTSALTQLSSIAWHYLKSYCEIFNCSNAKCVNNILKDRYEFLTVDELKVDFMPGKKNHKMIGNTPFTSLHICYWFDIDESLSVTRVNKDALVCVMICFGPKGNESKTVLKFKSYKSSKESETKLQGETIYVYWPQKYSMTVSGIPTNYLLLSFYIEESVVKKIQKLHKQLSKQGTGNWYEMSNRESSTESQKIVSGIGKLSRRRKRVGTLRSSCESVSLGYIELEMPEKQFGDKRSCLQDAFINAAFLLEIDISTQLYNEVPPKRTINTKLNDVLGACVVRTHFRITKEPDFTTEKGGKEWVLLRCRQKTGLYVVWCTVEYEKSRKEKHAFVYNSNFTTWNNEMKYHGAIIDNRKLSHLRAFEKEDLVDIGTTRKTLSDYFFGETRIQGWIKIERKFTS